MYAKTLESVFSELCQKGDVIGLHAADLAQRSDALRRYGRLPRGRDKRAQLLSNAEISNAILGLVAAAPGWAGHVSLVLGDLRPVGGVDASFRGAANLTKAIELLLSDAAALKEFDHLSLSVAEYAINSHGQATLTYHSGGARHQIPFVSKMAVSLSGKGAERDFDFDFHHSPFSRHVVFNRRFFTRLIRVADETRRFPSPPPGDGSEYNAEEAQERRMKALGVKRGSRFLNVGVDTHVTWPKEEMLVKFDRYHFVLMPRTKDHSQSIHVDLMSNKLSDREAMTVINRFLSVLTWCDDQHAAPRGGWSGNPIPVGVPKHNPGFSTAQHWPFSRKISTTDEQRRALALYREGRNAEETDLVSYAVLSYYKIIELRNPDSKRAKRWIGANFSALDQAVDNPELARFLAECGAEPPAEYIYTACRLAVAHASVKRPSDADDSAEISRLYTASYVLRRLARILISKELGVSDEIYSGT